MSGRLTHLPDGFLLFNGNYRIEKILGQGGFGITYLARDLNLDRLVAIKEFFPKIFCEREEGNSEVTGTSHITLEYMKKLQEKFLKEARRTAKLDYPGIIKIYTAFQENGTSYYVMEYIEGESLSEYVKRYGPMSVDLAKRYIIKVGEALEYLHARNINHLDVKPGNIMIRRSTNQPVLIDFGMSKQYDFEGREPSTTPIGISHGFAPVEQYHSGGVKEFSPRSDLYSLAATFYYLITGNTPPPSTEILNEELFFPGNIPSNIISAIKRAMSPAINSRHESVTEFLREIDSAYYTDSNWGVNEDEQTKIKEVGKGIKIPEDRTPESPTPPRQNKALVVTIVVLCVLCLGMLGFFVYDKYGFGFGKDGDLDSINQEKKDSLRFKAIQDSILARLELERIEKLRIDSLRQDSINKTAARKREQEKLNTRETAYDQMERLLKNSGSNSRYFLTEHNSDGIPELWLEDYDSGTLRVYAFSNGNLRRLGDISGLSSTSLRARPKYIMGIYDCYPYETRTRYEIKNNSRLSSTVVYDRNYEWDDYYPPDEQSEVVDHLVSDTSHLRHAFDIKCKWGR